MGHDGAGRNNGHLGKRLERWWAQSGQPITPLVRLLLMVSQPNRLGVGCIRDDLRRQRL